jgi:hypothetical protein
LVATQILRDVLDRHADESGHPLVAHAGSLRDALDILDALHRPA